MNSQSFKILLLEAFAVFVELGERDSSFQHIRLTLPSSSASLSASRSWCMILLSAFISLLLPDLHLFGKNVNCRNINALFSLPKNAFIEKFGF